MDVNRKLKTEEHKTLHQKISMLEQPTEDTKEISGKGDQMGKGDKIHCIVEAFSLKWFILLRHHKVVRCLMFIIKAYGARGLNINASLRGGQISLASNPNQTNLG